MVSTLDFSIPRTHGSECVLILAIKSTYPRWIYIRCVSPNSGRKLAKFFSNLAGAGTAISGAWAVLGQRCLGSKAARTLRRRVTWQTEESTRNTGDVKHCKVGKTGGYGGIYRYSNVRFVDNTGIWLIDWLIDWLVGWLIDWLLFLWLLQCSKFSCDR